MALYATAIRFAERRLVMFARKGASPRHRSLFPSGRRAPTQPRAPSRQFGALSPKTVIRIARSPTLTPVVGANLNSVASSTRLPDLSEQIANGVSSPIMPSMTLALIPLVASLNAAFLAAALAQRAWTKRAWSGLYAAAYLAIGAAAVSLITLGHANAAFATPLAAFIEGALTLVSGPLLVLFTTSLLDLRQRRAALLLPLAVFAVTALIRPDWASRAFFIERLVLVQMGFTAYAAWRVLTAHPIGQRAARAKRIGTWVVATLSLVHLAQTIRMLWSTNAMVTDVVPFAGAAAFLALTGAVYLGGRITALDPLTEALPVADAQSRSLAAALDRVLSADMLRDPDLTLARTASALDAAPEAVARALAATSGLSFLEYLQHKRVEAARYLLEDPDEARTSVEAIGLLVGFGSRSAFYKAFGERVGLSPAKYRVRRANNDVQKPKTGQ